MEGTNIMDETFSRQQLLLGRQAMENLQQATVLLFGAGGVGAAAAEGLARGGVGGFILVDGDQVALSNCNRQLIALRSTIGRDKVQVLKERILDINPQARVQAHKLFYLPQEAPGLFDGADFVVDAIDTVSAKIDIALQCMERQIPLISSMGTGNHLDPFALRIGDIYETNTCPLCRVMRRELKKRQVPALRVLYSTEPPVPFAPDGGEPELRAESGRPSPGSVSFVPPVAGLLIASEVIKHLAKGREKQP
jgi:tRNA A37 threonylcarbamoyladenosine dehydratase